jgi:hypothetical protein
MTQEELEGLVRGYAGAIDGSLREMTGQRIGYCLMLFDFGESGSLAYGSNAQRADMIKTLDEFREKLRSSRTS